MLTNIFILRFMGGWHGIASSSVERELPYLLDQTTTTGNSICFVCFVCAYVSVTFPVDMQESTI